jgi:hypothetical protein
MSDEELRCLLILWLRDRGAQRSSLCLSRSRSSKRLLGRRLLYASRSAGSLLIKGAEEAVIVHVLCRELNYGLRVYVPKEPREK